MFTEIVTVMQGIKGVYDLKQIATTLWKGDKKEQLLESLVQMMEDQIRQNKDGTDELKQLLSSIKQGNVEKLDERMLYLPEVQVLRDTSRQAQQLIDDLRTVKESLLPFQRALGEDLLSSALMITPDKMQQAFKDPWKSLIDVRPLGLASRPSNPDLIPIAFEHGTEKYLGWQMLGMLPMMFNCELEQLWISRPEIILPRPILPEVPDLKLNDDPISSNESIQMPAQSSVTDYPKQPDFEAIFNAERDPFEYPEEFVHRYQMDIARFNLAVSQHEAAYQAGIARLDRKKYDIHSGEFPVEIVLQESFKKSFHLPLQNSIQASRADAIGLWGEGQEKPLFVTLQATEPNKIKIQQVFVVGLQKRWGLKVQIPKVPKVGEEFRDQLKSGGHAPPMIILPTGSFKMGSNDYDSEKPIHEVKIDHEFAIGKYQVTFEDYDLYCEKTGQSKPSDSGWGRGKRPVINVSSEEAVKYCEWLSKETDKQYRLPSEAEWEYACRATSQTQWCFGDNENQLKDYAWYSANSGSKTHPVGEKKPNKFGLFDMHGNVWEWCEDSWEANYQTPRTQAARKNSNGNKLLRGGSWDYVAEFCRSSYRNGSSYGSYDNGFRLALFLFPQDS
jgi:formylglycine-generating enzyme required for sulfatase activity